MLLCCDGPLNGQYREVRGDVVDGDIVNVVTGLEGTTYAVATWTATGERVLVYEAAKREVEEFANAPYDWKAEADFDFPLSALIQEAVRDAEVR